MLSPFLGMAQVITGRVVDANSGDGIFGVHIVEQKMNIGASTDENGLFRMRSKGTKGVLKFTHVAYSSESFAFNKVMFSNGVFELEIKMLPGLELPEATIEARPKPVVVFENKLRHVAEYEFLDNGLVVLSYTAEKTLRSLDHYSSTILKEAQLYLSNNEQDILDSLYLGTGEFSLMNSFRKTPILLKGEEPFELSVIDGNIELKEINKDTFHEFYLPTVDTLGHVNYVSTFDPSYPSFEYYAMNKRDSSYILLKNIRDDLGMEFMRSEYKYLSGRDKVNAMNMAKRTGVDKKVIAAYMRGFHQSQYFETPYAPLYVLNDTLLIFDHFKDHFYKINKWNSIVDSVHFSYHKKLKYGEKFVPNQAWIGELFMDDLRNEISTSFDHNGFQYLSKIDLNTGNLGDPFKLTHRYIEELRLKDGFAFYIYRPFESSLKKYLYKERVY